MRQSTRVKPRCLTGPGMAVKVVRMVGRRLGMETCLRKRILDMVLPGGRIVEEGLRKTVFYGGG